MPPRLPHVESALRPPRHARPDRPAEWSVTIAQRRGQASSPLPSQPVAIPLGHDRGTVVVPRVDHGRWVVDCPFCPSAQYAAWSDPRFWCPTCEMAENGGRWVSVEWPPEAMVERVEAILEARPEPRSRNWRTGESVAALRSENRAHGLPEEARR